MGLDMFLRAKRFVPEGELQEKLKGTFPEVVDFLFSEVSVEVMYWRKANEIHRWFVENVQGNQDDCGEYYVSHRDLRDLLELIEEALETQDEQRLPTMQGFFFGFHGYDEYYWYRLKETVKVLRDALNSFSEDWSFYYRSSW